MQASVNAHKTLDLPSRRRRIVRLSYTHCSPMSGAYFYTLIEISLRTPFPHADWPTICSLPVLVSELSYNRILLNAVVKL